jgi:hypothetical protein
MLINTGVDRDASTSTDTNSLQGTISMTIYSQIPAYTYKITCRPTGQFYFGYREGNIKAQRLPADDFWIHYYSSSQAIAQLIQTHGVHNFLTEIILTDSPENTYWFEQEQIKLHWGSSLLLNSFYIDPHSGRKAFRTTTESAKKARVTMRERGTDILGAKKGQETMRRNGTHKAGREKFKITVAKTGVLKRGAAKQWETRWETGIDNTKLWEITSPDGITSVIRNMAKFCREHGLCNSAMTGVSKGACSQHKGWRCKVITDPPPDNI